MKKKPFFARELVLALVMLLPEMLPAQELKMPSASEGKCIQFDGIDDVVNAGDIDALDNSQHLTAEMWVRIDKFDAWRTFFCKFQNLANRIQFQQYSEPGKIALCVNNNADIGKEGNQAYYNTTAPEVTIGDWFHLAMVFDGSLGEDERLKLYINGMIRPLKKEVAAKGAVPTHTPATSAPLLLGAEKANGAHGFKGLMDEIRIWTVARTAEEIRSNMELQLTGAEDGLRLYYPVGPESETAGALLDRSPEKQQAKLVNLDTRTCFIDRDVAVPATAASAPKAEEPSGDGIRVVWIRGSGSANLVFATDRETGLPQPEPGVTYTANPEYGKGSRIGESHWYCVYNGHEAQASVAGLTPQTDYRLSVVDYNGSPGSEQYKVDSSSVMTFTTAAPPDKKFQELSFTLDSVVAENRAPIALGASASSGLPIVYKSNDTTIAQIVDNTLRIRSPGTATISASQEGNNTWLPAADVSRTLVVVSSQPVTTPVPPPEKIPFTLKKTKPFLIGGVAVITAGAVIGIIAAVSGNDEGGGDTGPLNNVDRPPRDPVTGIGP